MKKDKTSHFKYLIQKYRSNHLSPEEFEEFIQLLSEGAMKEAELLDDIARPDWTDSRSHLQGISRAQKIERRRRSYIPWIWRSAAAVLLLSMVWVFWPPSQPEDMVYTTGYGETKNIELPDGSKVLLNANSKMIWSGDWEKREKRKVDLEGEAFFDVVNIEAIHFEVNTSDLKVDVMGTEFNIKNRGKETDVFLQSGKVHLDIPGEQTQAIEMDPGDYIKFDHSEKKITSVTQATIHETASWVDGMLDFQNEKISDILKEFETLYGKSFLVKNEELLDKRLDLSLPYADWDLIQKALEIALGVKFSVSEETITVE